jgi:hypothetical protein
MAVVIPFPEMTPEKALARIRELALTSANIGWPSHVRKRMEQRKVSRSQVAQALSSGTATEGPYEDVRGNWVCNLSVRSCGRHVEVVVKMVNCRLLILKTVIV